MTRKQRLVRKSIRGWLARQELTRRLAGKTIYPPVRRKEAQP